MDDVIIEEIHVPPWVKPENVRIRFEHSERNKGWLYDYTGPGKLVDIMGEVLATEYHEKSKRWFAAIRLLGTPKTKAYQQLKAFDADSPNGYHVSGHGWQSVGGIVITGLTMYPNKEPPEGAWGDKPDCLGSVDM